jgi:hypothetical protein
MCVYKYNKCRRLFPPAFVPLAATFALRHGEVPVTQSTFALCLTEAPGGPRIPVAET